MTTATSPRGSAGSPNTGATLQPLQHSVFGGNAEHYLWVLRRKPLSQSSIFQLTDTSRV